MTPDQSSGGTCTWLLQLANGGYVYDPAAADGHSGGCGFSVDSAYLWLSADRALETAARTRWIGAGARARRARP